MANKKDYVERGDLILCFVSFGVIIALLMMLLIYNDSRIDKLEDGIGKPIEYNLLEECCLNGDKLICPSSFVSVGTIIIDMYGNISLDLPGFNKCNSYKLSDAYEVEDEKN